MSRPRPICRRPAGGRPPSKHSLASVLTAIALLLLAPGCESRDSPPEAWSEVEMASQPQLLERRHGHPALAELEGLFLGQSHDAAVDALDRYCEQTVRRDSTFGGEAYFLGCRVKNHSTLQYVRVGFWPKIGERTATLELKRPSVPPAAVYRRLRQQLDESIVESSLGPQLIEVQTKHYRFLADWDQGLDGPTHLVVGFAPGIDPTYVAADR